MQGALFRYGPAPAQVAFCSAAPSFPRHHLVLIAGLTEGLHGLPYTEQLSAAAAGAGYALVQAQLTSSYQVARGRGTDGRYIRPPAAGIPPIFLGTLAGRRRLRGRTCATTPRVAAPTAPAPLHPRQGWGVGSLDADADELLLLSTHLRQQLGSQGLVLMGHSTGCQVRWQAAA